MKLCFSTIGCPDWRLQEIVSAAKDLGYDAIEVRGLGGEIYAPAAPEFTTDFDGHSFTITNGKETRKYSFTAGAFDLELVKAGGWVNYADQKY